MATASKNPQPEPEPEPEVEATEPTSKVKITDGDTGRHVVMTVKEMVDGVEISVFDRAGNQHAAVSLIAENNWLRIVWFDQQSDEIAGSFRVADARDIHQDFVRNLQGDAA